MRPIGVSNTGKPRSPGSKKRFSAAHRCTLRNVPMWPDGPTTTAECIANCRRARRCRPRCRVVAASSFDPGGRRGADRHFLGQRKSLVPTAKNVAGIGKFRENDQVGALGGRLFDPPQALCHVGLLGADDRLHLNAGNGNFTLCFRHWAVPKTKNPRARLRGEQPEAP